MKRYRTRPGVVLTTISGQNVLVSAKSVQGLCPFTAQINETTAFCWRVREEYEIEDAAAVRADLEQLVAQMLESNYLIEES